MELVMALAISGAVLLGARVLLVQSTDSMGRIAASAEENMSAANAERMLDWLLLQLDTADAAFVGNRREARFQSWCDTPYGWKERCFARVHLVDTPAGGFVTIDTRTRRGEISVRTAIEGNAFTYLVAAAHGGSWLDDWSFQLTLPQAIGLVGASDTTILRIGLNR
jgi:hypothetical protein